MSPSPTNDPFADASDAFIDKEALQGRLLLITVLDSEEHESTRQGSQKATYTHYITTTVILDGDETDLITSVPMVLDGYHFFGSGLDGQLSPKLREVKSGRGTGMILGRLDKEPSAKKGNNPMDILRPPTEDDRKIARKYIAENPNDPFGNAGA
jgi:hypothetical protein